MEDMDRQLLDENFMQNMVESNSSSSSSSDSHSDDDPALLRKLMKRLGNISSRALPRYKFEAI